MPDEVLIPDASWFGWENDPAAHEAARQAVGIIAFADAAPFCMTAPIPDDILLYRAYKDALGQYPGYPAQQIGDCESFGNGHADDLSQCVEMAIDQSDTDYRETCTEALYAAGREAGGMLGRGDGCYGSAMVKAMVELGVVPREAVGAYSGQRAKLWGRTGMPADVRKIAAEHKFTGGAALVTTGDEAIAALAAGYPVPISSDCGFQGHGGFKRDANGFCYVGGSWPHCMCIVGRISSDGQDSFVIAQSWGPTMPSGPVVLDMPVFCFRARRSDVERYILSKRDSYAITRAPAFAKRALPSNWTVADFGG